jgi:hypothetical protein
MKIAKKGKERNKAAYFLKLKPWRISVTTWV